VLAGRAGHCKVRRAAYLVDAGSGFLFDQDLAALVHPGLQIEMMRAAQFAGILVLNVSRLLQRVSGTAHATPRGRGFSSRNGHVMVLAGFFASNADAPGAWQGAGKLRSGRAYNGSGRTKLERFRAKWNPARAKKTRQNNGVERRRRMCQNRTAQRSR